MKTRPPFRKVACAFAFAGAFGWTFAYADIYTWTDSSGNVNLSNRLPPEGARVTNVFREDPAVRASAEAARAATQREELRALSDRVKQLEHDLDDAKRPAPAPVVYAPPAPAAAPAPYPSVIAQTFVTPATPAYGDCSNPWASCFSPGSFGFYPSGVVVLSGRPPHRLSHRFHADHRGQRIPVRPLPTFPKPVGALPDPVNLFPGTGRR